MWEEGFAHLYGPLHSEPQSWGPMCQKSEGFLNGAITLTALAYRPHQLCDVFRMVANRPGTHCNIQTDNYPPHAEPLFLCCCSRAPCQYNSRQSKNMIQVMKSP